MMRLRNLVGVLSAFAAGTASAQPCGHWADGFGINELGGRIEASLMFDDGTGEALYVAGDFGNDNFPGRRGVAKWNGTSFVAVGGGLDGRAYDLAVFDDDGPGPHGPALYVAGKFSIAGGTPANSIARWDGASWSPLGDGVNSIIFSLTVHDDGAGPGLYAGGDFSFAGTATAPGLAMWRGGEWHEVGGGVYYSGTPGYVDALESFQGGLYVGGFFTHAGPLASNSLAQWRNGAWTNLGDGVSYGGFSAQVSELLAVDLPSTGGAALIVTGTMDSAGGAPSGPVARWNGSSWASMFSGFSSSAPGAIAVFDDGTGAALYVAGDLPPGTGVCRWSDSQWQLIGATPVVTGVPFGVDTLTVLPGNRLFAGGMFTSIAGVPTPYAAALQNNQWSAFGPFGRGFDGPVNALGVFDVGDGARLYAVGSFKLAGGVQAAGVARWGASGWESLATSMFPTNASIRCMRAFNDGSGPALYIGGFVNNINGVAVANVARWRPGAGWSPLGAGLSSSNSSVFGTVYDLVEHDQDDAGPGAPSLFATGLFRFTGATAITNVARWTGSGWASVGSGPGPNGTGGASLASVDLDGAGGAPPKLYFGGVFLPISSWDGAAWTEESPSPQATVVSEVGGFDIGGGPELYAGGDFDGPFEGSLGRRSDIGWEEVGVSPLFPNGGGSGGVADNGSVMSMTTFDDGSGNALYMTGIFGALNVEGYVNIASWNGSNWSGLGGGFNSRFPGTNGRGASMVVFDDGTGTGPALFVGGKMERYFTSSTENYGRATNGIAKWVSCRRVCPPDFDGDGDVGTDADIEAFFACLAGSCCATCPSNADFNGDGDVGTDADIEAFFRVLAGNPC